MTDKVINLNKVRKQKNRIAKKATAETNRAKYGQPKLQRNKTETFNHRQAELLDQHRLKKDGDTEPEG